MTETDPTQMVGRWVRLHTHDRPDTPTLGVLTRCTPTAAVRWTPAMQADMDEIRAQEAQTRAEWLTVQARVSRQEATAPTENPYPTEEPLEDWERKLLL